MTLHCENGGAIEALRRRALAEGRTGILEHARTRPAELEAEAVARAAALAERAQTSVYVVHLSSAPALAEVRKARERGVDVIAETCPQYLYLDTARLTDPDGESFVCTPPLRDPWHVEELWHGIATGAVQTVATDHCPFTVADRRAGVRDRASGFADFTEIPGGLPGIETRMGLVWEGVTAGRITRADWVRLCAEAPARTFGLWPAKGKPARRRRRRRGRVGSRARPVARRGSAAHGRRPLAVSRDDRDRLARSRVRARRARRPRRNVRGRARARPLRQSSSARGVQIVVDREAADAHRVGDALDRSSQRERAAVVEHPDRELLLFT